MTNAIQQPTPGEHVREHYRKQGEARAVARILERLEEYKCPCYCEVHIVLDPVIALIKEENSERD
jgi:hypothetical protein